MPKLLLFSVFSFIALQGQVLERERPHSLLKRLKPVSDFADKEVNSDRIHRSFSNLISHLEYLQKQENQQDPINARTDLDTLDCFGDIQNAIESYQESMESHRATLVIEERKAQKKADENCTEAREQLWKHFRVIGTILYNLPYDDAKVENAKHELQEAEKDLQFKECKKALDNIVEAPQKARYLHQKIEACKKLASDFYFAK